MGGYDLFAKREAALEVNFVIVTRWSCLCLYRLVKLGGKGGLTQLLCLYFEERLPSSRLSKSRRLPHSNSLLEGLEVERFFW